LSKELSNAIYEAAGRVVKLLRKDLKDVETDVKSIDSQLTDIQERVDKLVTQLSKIERHVKVIGER
jgi:septal ring factor EnvC (AmiA/AmiB activator)